MVLVDTSIWISHFKEGNPHLKELLLDESVLCHPFVIGELACGRLKNRKEIISLLQALPQAETVDNNEILQFIEHRRLMGTGIGLIDVHLLVSVTVTKVFLWTDDKQPREVAAKLEVFYNSY